MLSMQDQVVGIRKMSFEDKTVLKDLEFRGKDAYQIEFESAGTLIFVLAPEEVLQIAAKIGNSDQNPNNPSEYVRLTIEI